MFGNCIDLIVLSLVITQVNLFKRISLNLLKALALSWILDGYFAASIWMNIQAKIQVFIILHALLLKLFLNELQCQYILSWSNQKVSLLLVSWTCWSTLRVYISKNRTLTNYSVSKECYRLFTNGIFEVNHYPFIFILTQS